MDVEITFLGRSTITAALVFKKYMYFGYFSVLHAEYSSNKSTIKLMSLFLRVLGCVQFSNITRS